MRVILTLVVIFFACITMSQSAETIVDGIFKDFSGSATPGAAVAVVKNGKVVVSKAYGMADLERRIPCSIDTNYRLASVTKQFTAMAILLLVQRQQLALDDRLPKFFPEFPKYGASITVRHLLTHTSGLPDYEDHLPEGLKIPVSDRDVLHILREQKTHYFEPGSDFHYSNSGYACLALIVEVTSGKTFPAFLKENIFAPLGMHHSLAYVAGVSQVPQRAFGYARGPKEWSLSDQSLTSAVLGDGGIYSSAKDLVQWDQALYSEKLVRRQLLDEAFRAHSKKSDFDKSGYGYGFYVGEHKGVQTIWHYGSTCGFRTHYVRFPEKELSVLILANRRDADLEPIATKLANLYW